MVKSFDQDERRSALVPKTDRFAAFYPKLMLEPSGRLLCQYGRVDFEHQVHQTVLMASMDRGRTWKELGVLEEFPGLPAKQWGGRPFNCLSDGRLVMMHNEEKGGFSISWSKDGGSTWSEPAHAGGEGSVPGPHAVVEASNGDLILTTRSSTQRLPVKKRVLMYRSRDRGKSWEGPRTIAEDPILNLTEPSTIRLRDGRLMSVIRENSYNYYPTYKIFSNDHGETWSGLQETPMVGHQLVLGQLQSGRILVVYRHMGGYSAAMAWMGDPDDPTGYQVTGRQRVSKAPRFLDDYMKVKTAGGDECVQYFLRAPDDQRSVVCLEAELRCLINKKNACAFHIAQAGWVAIYPDCVELPDSGELTSFTGAGQFRRYRITRTEREMTISVDGVTLMRTDKLHRGKVVDNVGGHIAFANYNSFGTLDEGAWGEVDWRSVKLSIKNPIHDDYEYEWQASSRTLPNQYEEDHMIEIDNNYGRNPYYCGQTSWVQFPDGEIFVVSNISYDRLDGRRSSWLRGCTLHEDDFKSS